MGPTTFVVSFVTRILGIIAMKYAIYLPTFDPFGNPKVIASLARDAEQSGWDGFFIWDDVAASDKDLADAWISLAAAAVATQQVRLGVLVTPLARRRPWKFARETASLDHLSGGRLVVGVGVGGGQEQFGDLGDEPNQRLRGEMLDEGLAVVSGLWSGDAFEFDGAYYQLKPTVFRPKPLQQPRIPIWVAGVWPNKRPLARMARWDGMFPLFWGVDDLDKQQAYLKQMVSQVREMRAELLPDSAQFPFDVVVVTATDPAQPAQSAEQVAGFAAAGATWMLESLEPAFGGGQRSFGELRARVLAGPPAG
jgi:alkanesulfonate monooxygenase SsuD/methylene tetrahydromethanopterin reductase-like flavin-dependent oxidoreductase (luciferase family)